MPFPPVSLFSSLVPGYVAVLSPAPKSFIESVITGAVHTFSIGQTLSYFTSSSGLIFKTVKTDPERLEEIKHASHSDLLFTSSQQMIDQ